MKNKSAGYMTIVILGLLAIALVLTLSTGCAAGGTGNDASLSDIVEKLYKDVDVPAYETIELTKDTFESYAFISYDDSLSAVAADALVNITPHSLVVINSKDGNGKDLAEEILINADPNKWLCVGSEIVEVGYTDHYVVLVMSYEDIADDIMSNFKNIAKDLDSMDANVLTAGNTRYDESF